MVATAEVGRTKGFRDVDMYAFEAEITSINPIGLTARGLRLDLGFTGTITEGPLQGCTIDGIDYALIRPDGVAVIDARELVRQGDQVVAAVRAEGYIVPPFPMPELAVLAAPDFTWPDVDLPLNAAAFIETAREDLKVAAATVYGATGTVNVATGILRVAARSLALSPQTVDA